jgi:AraC-like DNA-binding protein
MKNYFDGAPSSVARWRDLGYSIVQAIPEVNLAGHRIRLHEIRTAYTAAGIGMPLHRHTFFEGIYVLSGKAHETSGDRRLLSRGTVFLNPPNVLHGWEAPDSDLLRFIFWFTVDRPLEVDTGQPYLQDVAGISDIAALLETVRRAGPGWRDCAASRMTLLLASMLHSARWPGAEAAPTPAPSGRVSEAVDHFLRDNVAQPLALRDIATHCGLSIPTLTRHLRQEGHRGAMATLLVLRMELAADMLTNSAIPVNGVGRRCGFENASYFNHCFREHHGCTPGEYRGEHLLKTPAAARQPRTK